MRLHTAAFIFLLTTLFVHAQSFDKDQLREFKQNQDIKITAGYLEVDPIGGFADGKYKLEAYELEHLKENLYKIKMLFILKKKKYLRYKQELELPLLYDTKKLWIKYKGRVYRYKVPKNSLVRYKKGNKEYIKKADKVLKVKMENLALRFELN